jgi:preprotein translocase subunit SecY
MKANGGFIPGIRPGKATVEYLNRVMTRITFVGAIFLAAVAILPTIVSQLGGLNFHFGGTSLLIAVGVAPQCNICACCIGSLLHRQICQ